MNYSGSGYFMRQAFLSAEKSCSAGEIPVGAVIVEGERIIGRGHNRQLADSDPSAHAEIVALRNACREKKNFRLDGSLMYVTIKPCLMCREAIRRARIKKVYFAAAAARESTHHTEYEPLKDFAAGSEKIIKDFFRRRRK